MALFVLQGNRLFGVQWFYRNLDTMLAVKGTKKTGSKQAPIEWDDRRIFKASPWDGMKGYQSHYPIDVIERCHAGRCQATTM
jgi:hypothetical protein